MSFDQNDPHPLLQPRKRTTKVNIFMAIAVFVFLALTAGMMIYYHVNHPTSDSRFGQHPPP